jgi:hypothetical protein
MDYTFKTDYNFIFIPVIILISFLISYFYYKNSKSEPLQKALFTSLRFLSVFSILLLFLSPVFSFIKDVFKEPVNVVLLDNSLSLTIENRQEELKQIVTEKIGNSFQDNSENRYFLYSGNLGKEINEDEINSLSYSDKNNLRTNLTSSINSLGEQLRNKNLSSVTIISDGIINEGGNPFNSVKSLNSAFNYILIGDTIQKNDVLVKNVFYDKNVFKESNVPVKVEINSYNYNRNITVNLYEEDLLTDTKDINVTEGIISYEVSFSVRSDIETIKKYKVEIPVIENEITDKNNSEEFFIRFTDNKFKVLVLAGGPSPDLAFIKEEIGKVKNFETTFLTQKSATEFYEGTEPDLSLFDSYIFVSYPTGITNISILNRIKENIEKNKSSLIFIAGKNADYKKLAILESNLPFKPAEISEAEEETGIKSVIVTESEIFKSSGLLTSVNNFPNIFKTKTIFSINPSSETFLISSKNSEPAFIIENSNRNRSAAFLAYGFYRWRLNAKDNNSGEVFNYLISNSLIAITDKEKKNKFKLETTKPVYSKFENVKFDAQITNFDLKGGEYIKVNINGKEFKSELKLSKINNEFYNGEINIPVNGDYEFTGELFSGNTSIQSVKGRFLIAEDNREFKQTRADNSILSSLATETGGSNFSNQSSAEIKSILNEINKKSGSEYRARQNFEFNVNPYFLMFVIFLLCLEWFFRKRNNLP